MLHIAEWLFVKKNVNHSFNNRTLNIIKFKGNGEGIIPVPYKRTELHFTVTKLTYTDYVDILFDVNKLNFVESGQGFDFWGKLWGKTKEKTEMQAVRKIDNVTNIVWFPDLKIPDDSVINFAHHLHLRLETLPTFHKI